MSFSVTIVPSSSMKAIVSGTSVFYIQKQCWAAWSKTNSMPLFGCSD